MVLDGAGSGSTSTSSEVTFRQPIITHSGQLDAMPTGSMLMNISVQHTEAVVVHQNLCAPSQWRDKVL